MNKEKYTFEEVMAYSIIGLFELMNIIEKKYINLHSMVWIMEKLENKYSKDLVVDFACKLIEAEGKR